jgi:hypothetical protein
MGFFDLTGIRDPAVRKGQKPPTQLFTIKSGTSLDGSITKEVADSFATTLQLTENQKGRVQVALNEALENISEHAYLDTLSLVYPAERGRWWIAAMAFDTNAYLLACDFGVTIPNTVPSRAKERGLANFEALSEFLKKGSKTHDEKLICAAFEDGVTRRENEKGGRGLGRMKDLVEGIVDGSLTIWSGGAVANINSKSKKLETLPLGNRFEGTYVLWTLSRGPDQ